MNRQVDSLGEVLPQQAIGVFIGSALPRALRVAMWLLPDPEIKSPSQCPGIARSSNRRRSLTDGYGIVDLPPSVATLARLPGSTDRPPRPKVLKQLLFKHTACLNKQTAIDGLMRHLMTPTSWMLSLKPFGNLLRATN